jgi:hypothetical protein
VLPFKSDAKVGVFFEPANTLRNKFCLFCTKNGGQTIVCRRLYWISVFCITEKIILF